jgi:signal transduction histidine kinase
MLERVRADVRRPERPTARAELTFHVVAPLVIIVIAQIADPGTAVELLALVPVVAAFAVRPVTRLPAEVFALAVVVPIQLVVGREGNLEGVFFLSVIMVLYTSWTLGSVTRAAVIAVVASVGPWMVATQLAPSAGIGWTAWVLAHTFTFVLGRTLRRQRTLIDELEAAREQLARQAVADERRRMARELHDIAGHTVAAMALHVTGARHVLKRDVDEADAALRDAEAVGRDGLDQIRATVAALAAESSKVGSTALARWRKSSTAADRAGTPADSGYVAPLADNGRRGNWRSPVRRSGARLVASTVSPWHAPTSSATTGTASGRCSRLSRSTSIRLSPRCRFRV